MDIFELMLLAAEGDTDSAFDGMFSGAQGVVGIVLMVTGVLLIYFAVKVLKGYRFLPASGGDTVIGEDNYVGTEAKAVEKITSTMPDFNGGADREFVEWKIVYTVDGKEFSQLVPDDGYDKDDVLKIKYDPDKPDSFYLVDEEQEMESEDDAETEDNGSGRITGLVLAVLGVLLIMGGAALKFM